MKKNYDSNNNSLILERLFQEIAQLKDRVQKIEDNQETFASEEMLQESLKNKPSDEDVAIIVSEIASQKILELSEVIESSFENFVSMQHFETKLEDYDIKQHATECKINDLQQKYHNLSSQKKKKQSVKAAEERMNMIESQLNECTNQFETVDKALNILKNEIKNKVAEDKLKKLLEESNLTNSNNNSIHSMEEFNKKLLKFKKVIKNKADRCDVEKLANICEKAQTNFTQKNHQNKEFQSFIETSLKNLENKVEPIQKQLIQLDKELHRKGEKNEEQSNEVLHLLQEKLGGNFQKLEEKFDLTTKDFATKYEHMYQIMHELKNTPNSSNNKSSLLSSNSRDKQNDQKQIILSLIDEKNLALEIKLNQKLDEYKEMKTRDIIRYEEQINNKLANLEDKLTHIKEKIQSNKSKTANTLKENSLHNFDTNYKDFIKKQLNEFQSAYKKDIKSIFSEIEKIQQQVVLFGESANNLKQRIQKMEEKSISNNLNTSSSLKQQNPMSLSHQHQNHNKQQQQINNDNFYHILKAELSLKVSADEFRLSQDHLKKSIHELEKKFFKKSSTSEQNAAALAKKTDAEEINNYLVEIKNELENKIDIDTFKKSMEDQEQINQLIYSETLIGKWHSTIGQKSGQTGLMIMELQIQNTVPEIFVWEEKDNSILITDSGFYSICACAVSENPPNLSLLVNGREVEKKLCDSSVSSKNSNEKSIDSLIYKATYINWVGLVPNKAAITVSIQGLTKESLLIIRKHQDKYKEKASNTNIQSTGFFYCNQKVGINNNLRDRKRKRIVGKEAFVQKCRNDVYQCDQSKKCISIKQKNFQIIKYQFC